MVCTYIFTRGKNKGCACAKKVESGKSFCKQHIIHEKPLMGLDNLPSDILEYIINIFVSRNPSVETYMAFACASKTTYDIMNSQEMYNKYVDKIDNGPISRDLVANNLPIKDVVRLVGKLGCEFCKAPRIRKIYKEFRVRCCQACLYQRSINEYYLISEYLIPQNLLKGCKYRNVQLYNNHRGHYMAKYYWNDDVTRAVGYDNLDTYKAIQIEHRVRKRNEDIAKYIIDKQLDISMEDINRLTSFVRDKYDQCNFEKYCKDAKSALRIERMETFLKSQEDYLEFPAKKHIASTTYYKHMMRKRKQHYERTDWDILKAQAIKEFERVQIAEQLNTKIKNFMEAPGTKVLGVTNVFLQTITLADDLNIMIPTFECAKNKSACQFCGKVFKNWVGMCDHTRDKHSDKLPIRFICC